MVDWQGEYPAPPNMLKLRDMKVGVSYVVSVGSKCGTFQNGDRVSMMKNGDIGNRSAGGWLEKKDIGNLIDKVLVIVNKDSLAKLKRKREELDRKIAEMENRSITPF